MEFLTVYLQICINTNKIGKAYTKYEELDQIVTMDATTYYLLSIMEVMHRRYDLAAEHIEKALTLDGEIPFYHLVKGIILYWKALPKDVCLADDFYPVMFTNGLLHMDVGQHQMLKDATEEYRKAYQLADNVNNREQVEVILSIWINTLSVDSSFQEEILEPLQLLKAKNPFDVTVLLYMLQRKMALDHEVSIESIERQLKKSQNKIGHVIVLIEFCLSKGDKKNAKRFLHEYRSLFFKGQYYEYWYEYIVKVEESKDKLAEYEEEISRNSELEEIRRNRLLCLFIQLDEERNEELEGVLLENYRRTENRLDLLNLIAHYKARRNWQEMLRYADKLVSQYNDAYGNIYRIQCLVELQKYDMALCDIEELESRHIYGTEKELLQYRMIVFERTGRYDDAIMAGQELLQKKPTEQIILKLSSLYSLNGEETESLNTLLKAEEYRILTVEICQRISVCYLTIDQRKAWDYAEKAVKLSDDQPEVMLWATNIANHVGKSDKAGEYYHHIMVKNPEHQLLIVKSVDEVLEMLRASSEEAKKRKQMLFDGELVSHLYVDVAQGNQTFAEFFYMQWNEDELIPLEFGAHYFRDDMLDVNMKKIVLDYSSCLLLHELGILEILCDRMEEVYVAGTLFGVISEELRKIPMNQPDMIQSRYQTMKKCQEEPNVTFVEVKIPENTESKANINYTYTINSYTAEYYKAEWVSDNGVENSTSEIEVITALYREDKISQDAFDTYKRENIGVREEKVQELTKKSVCLFVDFDVLQKWDDACFLSVVCENFIVIVNKDILEEIEQENRQVTQKGQICTKLRELRDVLLHQKDEGKIKFLPGLENRDGMDYSNMLSSVLTEAEKRHLPVCIDDRVLTSYSHVGESVIYNSLDVMKILFVSKEINLERYSTIYKKVIDKKIRYILPDIRYILYAMKISEVDSASGLLKESGMLAGIRKYVVEALSQRSYLRKKGIDHVQIPEWEYYIFNLQGQSRDLIRLIWQSDMENEIKVAASEWTLSHFSQFAFDFSATVNEEGRKKSYAIQLADFLLEGLLLGKDEKCAEQYYAWLYEWFDHYLSLNPDIKVKTLEYAKSFIVSFLRDAEKLRNKHEFYLVKCMFATGIYYMPEEYREYLLADDAISEMYTSIYCEISIVLTDKRHVPIEKFRSWEREVLALNENEKLSKIYQGVNFVFSWEYILPAFPGVNIYWKEGMVESVKKIFADKGARLKHDERNVRKREFKYIEPFLEDMEYGKPYLALQGQGKYVSAAEEILQLLDRSESFEEIRIERGLKDDWFGSEHTRQLMVPSWPDYFLQLYDFDAGTDEIDNVKENIALSIPLRFRKTVEKTEIDNHNPVRLLHKLESLLYSNAEDRDILTVIADLFSYADSEHAKYGEIYVLFLKCVWDLWKKLDNYMTEPLENHMIWTYIWVDKMMTSLTKLEKDKCIDVAKYLKRLRIDTGIDVITEGLWDSVEEEDIICPHHMNLYRICITGTLQICTHYEERMYYLAPAILNLLEERYHNWMQSPIHVREAELLHKNTTDIFKSVFTTNAYSIIEKLADIGNCKEKIGLGEHDEGTGNRVERNLRSMVKQEGVGMSDVLYLALLSRENMDEEQMTLIKEIIEKQVLGRNFQSDITRHYFLAYVIHELPGNFQREYIQHELKRLGQLLHLGKVNWEEAYVLSTEMAKISRFDDFLEFWETYADELDTFSALQVAQRIGWLQRAVPYEYGDRVRKLRMQLELRE